MLSNENSPIEMRETMRMEVDLSSIMQKVFFMMAGGLTITAITSLIVVSIPNFLLFLIDSWNMWVIAELVIVIFLSAKIEKIGMGTGILAFALYSIINGITLSVIYFAYTLSSIASAFFITAGMFAGAALMGKLTNRDLTTVGSYCMMGLIGLIIAGIVDIFIQNDIFSFVTSAIGIVIFIALTAYDVQRIKKYAESINEDDQDKKSKLIIIGALNLYLDFINIFLKLLRIMGNKKNN